MSGDPNSGGPVRRIPRISSHGIEPDYAEPLREADAPEMGHRRLMRAMLEDALMRLARGRRIISPSAAQEYREAVLWFESRSEDWGTFEFVCDSLGSSYEPGKIRLYVRRIIAGKATHQAIHRVSGTRTRMGGRIVDAD